MESYLVPRIAGSFSGVRTFCEENKINAKSARKWLHTQDAYTLHKPVIRRFVRRKTISKGIDDIWQLDLVDVSSLSKYNDTNRYLLTCIDVFSRFARAVPVKNKLGKTITTAFATMLNNGRIPNMIQTDKGSEFLNGTFQTFLRDNDISFYTSENDDIKASLVERWHRTIKGKMFRYFTYRNTMRYVDVLQDLIDSYNDTRHSALNMAPSAVTVKHEQSLRQKLYKTTWQKKWLFQKGDRVRISSAKRAFRKGYLPGWSEEIFTVTLRHRTVPVTYSIEDYSKETIKGRFYEPELQIVNKTDDVYRVERVLKTRTRAGVREYFVKWLGYPDKFNSWTNDIRGPVE